MGIRACIFDCFGVLYVQVGEDFYEAHIAEYETRRDELRNLGRQADLGYISQDDLIHAIAPMAHMTPDEVRDRLVGGLIRNQILLDFTQTLRPKYKVGVLSNISAHTMDAFFGSEERRRFFDDFVISSDVGMAKPDQEIFALACRRLGVAPEETVFIDDSPLNCTAAIRAGMQAVTYRTTTQTIQDLRAIIGGAHE